MWTARTLLLSAGHRHALTMKFPLETGQPRFEDSFIQSCQHMLQMPPSVFGQSIFGKPCFWQSIVWQTEWTENWEVMLLDIIRNIWSLTSYVNKSPINNMSRFLRREFQLMLTREIRITTINCRLWMLLYSWASDASHTVVLSYPSMEEKWSYHCLSFMLYYFICLFLWH